MAKKTAQGELVVARNRKARHDYIIEDTYEAGLALMGTEVKALRMGRASLTDGFAIFYGDELYLEGVHIPEYVQGTWTNHTPRRRRKLLLHRAELDKIAVKDVGRFEAGLLKHMRGKRQDVLDWITTEDPKIKGDAEDKLKAAIDEFAADFA